MSRREFRGRSEQPDTSEYEKKRDRGILSIFESVLLCNTRHSVDAAVMIARFVNSLGVSEQTYLLYFLLLGTNNAYVVDALVGERNPLLLFSTVKPHWYMLHLCFALFYRHGRDELNEKCLLALLGVIQNTYKSSKYGYNVYRLSVTDLYNIAKYLDKNKAQSDTVNRLILDTLLDIYQIGINARTEEKKQIAVMANVIRMAFFDDTKRMTDAIPEVLLAVDSRRIRTVKPTIEGAGGVIGK